MKRYFNCAFCSPRTYCDHCCCCKCECCCPPTPRPPKPFPPEPKPRPACHPTLDGIQAKLSPTEDQVYMDAGAPVLFDQVMHHDRNHIFYDVTTGVFTLNESGNYLINWQIYTEGTDEEPYVSLAITVDGEIYDNVATPVFSGQVICSTLLAVKKVPTKLSITNTTGETIQLSRHISAANITITSMFCARREGDEES